MSETTSAAVARGLKALDDDELEIATSSLSEARQQLGESHPSVLHLQGMLAWSEGDHERATGYLMQAVDLDPPEPQIYLDCAECLFSAGDDLDEAEAVLRAALQLPACAGRVRDEANLLLAQVRLSDDDVEEARELLDQIDASLREHPAYLSLLAAVQVAGGELAGAIQSLERAVAAEPEDADYRYQLGLTRREAGDEPGAREAFARVLELDLVDAAPEPPDFAEVQDLRSRLEELFEELPDPLLHLVASAPISVQGRATPDQVAAGVDPRAPIAFLGEPAPAPEGDAELRGIIIMRDPLLEGVEDEEELQAGLMYALIEELKFFFRRDDIVFSEAGD
jgi:thioredoxin-like negative regulator of GroEL